MKYILHEPVPMECKMEIKIIIHKRNNKPKRKILNAERKKSNILKIKRNLKHK